MDDVKVEYSPFWLLFVQVVLTIVTLAGVIFICVGLLVLVQETILGIGMIVGGVVSILYWRKRSFFLMEITDSKIIYMYLFWERSFSLEAVQGIVVVSFDGPAPWYKGVEEQENITINPEQNFWKRLYFMSVLKKYGAGSLLKHHVQRRPA